jgi:SAM-dependent methyltransferase
VSERPLPFPGDGGFGDSAEDYEHACHRGLALSGESRDYFAAQRIAHTAAWVRGVARAAPRRVADFGCGLGHTTPHLRQRFPAAALLGLDVSEPALAHARERYGGDATFAVVTEHRSAGDQDLVYCNGVFHHIRPAERVKWARLLRDLLAPGGLAAIWDNNPWNPGARWVMSRIPFDRDAITISSREMRQLLIDAGFEVMGTRFHFYFPRFLSWLRPLERLALRIPLGAQYCVLARKPLPRG